MRDQAIAAAETAFETSVETSEGAYMEASEFLDDDVDEQEAEIERLQVVCVDAYAAADIVRSTEIMSAHAAYDEVVESALASALG